MKKREIIINITINYCNEINGEIKKRQKNVFFLNLAFFTIYRNGGITREAIQK